MRISLRRSRLLRFDARKLDHFSLFSNFVCHLPAEVSRRAAHRLATKVGEPRLDLGIGKPRIGLGVELADDRGGCVLRRSKAIEVARLVTRHKLGYRRNIR